MGALEVHFSDARRHSPRSSSTCMVFPIMSLLHSVTRNADYGPGYVLRDTSRSPLDFLILSVLPDGEGARSCPSCSAEQRDDHRCSESRCDIHSCRWKLAVLSAKPRLWQSVLSLVCHIPRNIGTRTCGWDGWLGYGSRYLSMLFVRHISLAISLPCRCVALANLQPNHRRRVTPSHCATQSVVRGG